MPCEGNRIIIIWPIAILVTPTMESMMRAKTRSEMRSKTIRLVMRTLIDSQMTIQMDFTVFTIRPWHYRL